MPCHAPHLHAPVRHPCRPLPPAVQARLNIYRHQQEGNGDSIRALAGQLKSLAGTRVASISDSPHTLPFPFSWATPDLALLPNLKSLTVSNPPPSLDLAALSNLQELRLFGGNARSGWDPAPLAALPSLPGLARLELDVEGAGSLAALQQLQQLRSLSVPTLTVSLAGCTALTSLAVRAASHGFADLLPPNLVELSVERYTPYRGAYPALEADLQTISKLPLTHLSFTRSWLKAPINFTALSGLKQLCIPNMSPISLPLPLDALCHLTSLDVGLCPLPNTATAMTRLQHLVVLAGYCPQAVHRLPAVLPHLTSLTSLEVHRRLGSYPAPALGPMSALRQLRRLVYHTTLLDGGGYLNNTASPIPFHDLSGLTYLELGACYDAQMREHMDLVCTLTNLRHLTFSSQPNSFHPHFEALAPLASLRHITWQGGSSGVSDVSYHFSTLTQLTSLELRPFYHWQFNADPLPPNVRIVSIGRNSQGWEQWPAHKVRFIL